MSSRQPLPPSSEAPTHLRGDQEHEHPQRAGRAPRQADRGVRRSLHSDRVVRASAGRPRPGVELHRRSRAPHAHVRARLEVARSAGADGAAEPRRGALGPKGEGGRRPPGERRMVLTPRIGPSFVSWPEAGGNDETLGLVDFSIFPHLDNPELPQNTMATAERWAAAIGYPAYAIDDETAIKVVDGAVEVVSEGHWKLLEA